MPYKATLQTNKHDAARLADLLSELIDPPPAVSTVEAEGGWLVEIYFETPPEPEALHLLADMLPHLDDLRNLQVEPLVEEDWVAKVQRGLHPIEAGCFFIHGSHDRARSRGRSFAIEVDAGQAFGTAHHGTTRGCLLAIDLLAKSRRVDRALDLGTGSGILAIAAAKMWRGLVVATDIDPVAIDVARENFQRNNVGQWVRPIVANGVRHQRIAAYGPYELVIANILAGPLLKLTAGIHEATRPQGWLILSGLLDHQAREIKGRYGAQGFRLHRQFSLEGWSTLLMRRHI